MLIKGTISRTQLGVLFICVILLLFVELDPVWWDNMLNTGTGSGGPDPTSSGGDPGSSGSDPGKGPHSSGKQPASILPKDGSSNAPSNNDNSKPFGLDSTSQAHLQTLKDIMHSTDKTPEQKDKLLTEFFEGLAEARTNLFK